MAGNFPDPPGPRIAYDRNGSLGAVISEQNYYVAHQLTAGELTELNDEDGGAVSIGQINQGSGLVLFFPQLYDITHILFGRDFGANGLAEEISWSTNTTNGLDGTWTSAGTIAPLYTVTPGYRNAISTKSIPGIKAIRFLSFGNRSAHMVHLYGKLTTGQTEDRVQFWHPTLNQDLGVTPAHLDWGDVPRGTTETRQFRVKNKSATKTANSTVISVEALSNTTPDLPPQFLLSTDNVTFTPTLTITALAPGALSGVLYVRRTTPLDATLSLWACRLYAAPGSMT